jgi:hypothetical protein
MFGAIASVIPVLQGLGDFGYAGLLWNEDVSSMGDRHLKAKE